MIASDAARVGDALDWGLDRLYTSLASAEVGAEGFSVFMDIPGHKSSRYRWTGESSFLWCP